VRTTDGEFFSAAQTLNQLFRETNLERRAPPLKNLKKKKRESATHATRYIHTYTHIKHRRKERKKERNDDDDEKKEFLSRDDDDAGIVVSDEHHHDESVLVGGRGFDDCRSGARRNCFWK